MKHGDNYLCYAMLLLALNRNVSKKSWTLLMTKITWILLGPLGQIINTKDRKSRSLHVYYEMNCRWNLS